MSKKENLLKTIETAFNNTNNSCKQTTLYNYYHTVNKQSEDEIDYDWYYYHLKHYLKVI